MPDGSEDTPGGSAESARRDAPITHTTATAASNRIVPIRAREGEERRSLEVSARVRHAGIRRSRRGGGSGAGKAGCGSG